MTDYNHLHISLSPPLLLFSINTCIIIYAHLSLLLSQRSFCLFLSVCLSLSCSVCLLFSLAFGLVVKGYLYHVIFSRNITFPLPKRVVSLRTRILHWSSTYFCQRGRMPSTTPLSQPAASRSTPLNFIPGFVCHFYALHASQSATPHHNEIY